MNICRRTLALLLATTPLGIGCVVSDSDDVSSDTLVDDTEGDTAAENLDEVGDGDGDGDGDGETSGDGDTTGDGDGDTAGDGDGDTAGDGDPWDPDICMEPAQVANVSGLRGTFCSAPCEADEDCPAGPADTTPRCVLFLDGGANADSCALVCDPVADTCPAGATCKEVPDQPGFGICTYP